MLVWNINTAAVAAGDSVGVDGWAEGFAALIDRIAPRFTRYEPVRHAAALIAGLVSGVARKNCWTIAEHRGHSSPDALQHLLSRAKWDAEEVRDDLRGYVVDNLGDPNAVLVVDETGDLKKGTATVGVQRQYTGTAGRIENAQVAVYLTYAAPAGHAFIDRALYLPAGWAGDPQRRAGAKIPPEVTFATKPALAGQMITRAVRGGAPARWVAGDEVYGADPELRRTLRALRLGYVMQIAANRRVPVHAGPTRVEVLARSIPPRAWQIRSAGPGSKGQRWYSWAWIDLRPEDPDETGHHWLLIRRNDTTGELAYHRCYSPHPVTLAALVAVAGQRWRIEESFQAAKTLVGLDQHQVRTWISWHRWTVLAMLAHAFLTVTTASERVRNPAPPGLIRLSVNEFRRLFVGLLLTTTTTPAKLLAWSRWRRQHQARARTSHYQRREHQ